MKRALSVSLFLALFAMPGTSWANLLTNGDLDLTQPVQNGQIIVPKPASWVNQGTRSITGAYEDEMSSEPWAGPAPTPVTANGTGLPFGTGNGCGGPDCAVFFKPFSGNVTPNGLATGHLYQDNAATAGTAYKLTAWAGAEANALARRIVLALEFLDAANTILQSEELDLIAAGLFTDNGLAFDYKQFTVEEVAPGGTAFVRVRASMIDAQGNPAGGGQAIVFDDFVLASPATVDVPEPTTLALFGLGLAGLGIMRRRRTP